MTAILVLGATGCNTGGTDCGAAIGNAIALMRADIETEADSEQRRKKESMLPAVREELVTHCEAEKWNTATRQCIAKAKTLGELDACDPDKDRAAEAAKEEKPDDKPDEKTEPATE